MAGKTGAGKPAGAITAREACLDSLVSFEKDKSYSNIELDRALAKYKFGDLDRAFFTRLFYGVIERRLTLDFYIGELARKKADARVANILRMGLYQILYMERVPDSAAVSESVELAKMLKNKQAAGFVNAVMRNFQRRRSELEQKFENLNDLAIKYSCNYDIINIWEKSYGRETAENILKARAAPGFAVTVNSLKISRDEYFGKLADIGVKCEKISGYGVYILENLPVKSLYGYNDGLFFVQDEASQICALELGAERGDLILDACAAPGGKSLFIAQAIENKGRIAALDLHKNKLSLIKSSARRLGIDIIETYAHDARREIPETILSSKADRVLCDVPCSGLGVTAKKPEIKYKTLEAIAKLPDLQYEILENCAGYLKPGGVLLYSTCTLNRTENEDVVYKFLGKNNSFKLENMKTFFPFERKIDGFFLAKMRFDSV